MRFVYWLLTILAAVLIVLFYSTGLSHYFLAGLLVCAVLGIISYTRFALGWLTAAAVLAVVLVVPVTFG